MVPWVLLFSATLIQKVESRIRFQRKKFPHLHTFSKKPGRLNITNPGRAVRNVPLLPARSVATDLKDKYVTTAFARVHPLSSLEEISRRVSGMLCSHLLPHPDAPSNPSKKWDASPSRKQLHVSPSSNPGSLTSSDLFSTLVTFRTSRDEH